MTAIRGVFGLLALAFFGTPICLALVGVSAEEFENRRLAQRPVPSQGWGAFAQTTRYVVDHMPLRKQAVEANTRIWRNVFGSDPLYGAPVRRDQDKAIPFSGAIANVTEDLRIPKDGGLQAPVTARTGGRGWSYSDVEFQAACDKRVPDEQRLARWSRMVEAVRATGRDAVMYIAPSKASVYPEYLPAQYPRDDCAPDAKERFWRLLESEGAQHGVFELRGPLLQLKPSAGGALFYRQDSHWTTLGALVLVRAALDDVGDGIRLLPEEIVDRGRVDFTGDLSVASGDPQVTTRDEYGIERVPGAKRVPGRTLIVCDSFAYKWMRLFRAYFEDVRYITWGNSDETVREIRRSDRVIFEANESWLKLQRSYHVVPQAVARELATSGAGRRDAP